MVFDGNNISTTINIQNTRIEFYRTNYDFSFLIKTFNCNCRENQFNLRIPQILFLLRDFDDFCSVESTVTCQKKSKKKKKKNCSTSLPLIIIHKRVQRVETILSISIINSEH